MERTEFQAIVSVPNNSFYQVLCEQLPSLHSSYLCPVYSVSDNGNILTLTVPATEKAKLTLRSLYAAVCGALVLKTVGAAHTCPSESVCMRSMSFLLGGLDKLVPLTPETEQAELNELLNAAEKFVTGIHAATPEELREKLSVIMKQTESYKRRKRDGEEICRLLSEDERFSSRWKELKYINAGTYGFILSAVDASSGMPRALKVIEVDGDDEKDAQTLNEAGVTRSVSEDDNIVKTFKRQDVELDGREFVVLVMELLTPIPHEISDEETVVKLAYDICYALDRVHTVKLMAHRDVKPGNILKGDKHWKLCDFGISRMVEARPMATVIGTSDYMAPELLTAYDSNLRSTSYDNTVDLYALGLTMYTLLNRGTHPFLPVPPFLPTEEEIREAKKRRAKGDEFPKAVNCSEELMRIIRKACAFRPCDRYSSAARMIEALDDYMDDYGI